MFAISLNDIFTKMNNLGIDRGAYVFRLERDQHTDSIKIFVSLGNWHCCQTMSVQLLTMCRVAPESLIAWQIRYQMDEVFYLSYNDHGQGD